ncbi:helix-hairpin-helix protein [Marinilabilia salmonicolor]|uniref:ComEA family DNA-binding protein n=1 Tax=Marinilabilia salmonicolor TaxID=989 RepID=UPI000D422965|nr:helix-hairpin-helix domain-containing protein [Marinilabilia salmonicolor]PRZ01265.1 helix-hairpin-helix protein [Marinilabilia salmonicolor]
MNLPDWKAILYIVVVFICPIDGFTQLNEGIQEWAEEVASVYAEETDTEDLSFLIEQLTDLATNPINLNVAGREELEQIFFLTDIQVENILFKRYVNGPFLTIYELQAVEGLPVEVIQKMEPLIYLGATKKKVGKFRLWGDSFMRVGHQLERVQGFEPDESGESAYLGDRFSLYKRTQLETNRNVSAGIIAEKDPGEPMFGRGIDGIDLMSGYIHYENDKGLLREALAGRYSASAAQGLVLQSGMPVRKSSMTTSIRNRRASFRSSLSASEATGLEGGYAVLGYKLFEITPFYSLKRRDGRLNEAGEPTTLREDGFHRTDTEISQRHNVKEQITGVKASWSGGWLNLEAGYLNYQLDRPLKRAIHPYNQFYFTGQETDNCWLGYVVSRKNLLFFGELAINELENFALYNGLVWGAAPGFSLSLSHRKISMYYKAPLAGPMTESGSFQGESGFYCGIRWELPWQMVFGSYFDYYEFRWLRFRVDAPSSGFDWLGNLEKSFSRTGKLQLKFRYREKPVNWDEGLSANGIGQQKYNQLKIQYRQKINPGWQFTSQMQWHFVNEGAENHEGQMVAQDLKWNNEKQTITLTGRLAFFSASGYEARLYSYEPHVLYMFSVPAYSGKGSRYLLMGNFKIAPNLHLWLRAARWKYDDRDVIGSGNQQVNSNRKTELTFQVRLKF